MPKAFSRRVNPLLKAPEHAKGKDKFQTDHAKLYQVTLGPDAITENDVEPLVEEPKRRPPHCGLGVNHNTPWLRKS